MKPLVAESFFICFGSQEDRWLTLCSFTHCSQTLLWAFPDFTLTDFTDTQASGHTRSNGGHVDFQIVSHGNYFISYWVNADFYFFKGIIFPPSPVPSTWPNNLLQNLVFIVSLDSFFFKCYPVLGKMNPSVLSSLREQRDHQIHLNCCTKHLATALHLIRWRPFERCCRTRSWRALPSDDKKVNYWFVYHALKTQSALLNREHIKGGVLLKVF